VPAAAKEEGWNSTNQQASCTEAAINNGEGRSRTAPVTESVRSATVTTGRRESEVRAAEAREVQRRETEARAAQKPGK
jgi:hypothetical protein